MNLIQSCFHNPFCITTFLVEDEISKEGGLEVLSLHPSVVWEVSVSLPDSEGDLLCTSTRETFQGVAVGSILGMRNMGHGSRVCVWASCTFRLTEESVFGDSNCWWFLVKLESCSRTWIWRSIIPSMLQWKALCSASCSPSRWFRMVSCWRMRLLVSSEVPARIKQEELWLVRSFSLLYHTELSQQVTWEIVVAAVGGISCTFCTVGSAQGWWFSLHCIEVFSWQAEGHNFIWSYSPAWRLRTAHVIWIQTLVNIRFKCRRHALRLTFRDYAFRPRTWKRRSTGKILILYSDHNKKVLHKQTCIIQL